ncbi:hypothetical protein UCRPC4_g02559 [Phaeomoniella chlamydospora]|uniref:Uncharacterized protein n=1 Tax=Phaeomoniella chlamydospora TaxID=158046 RepID=A0A0G2GKS8_PHACM|nr:hypothetical protein UCRPC4_g02559 [Phaeomoniella chlamydospora]
MTGLQPEHSACKAIPYLLNEREYKLLHSYIVARAPPSVQERTLTPPKYIHLCRGKDDYHGASIRSALRVFLTVGTGLKSWELISARLLSRGKEATTAQGKQLRARSPVLRLALSLSAILYIHRLLHRYFLRLRSRLLAEKTEPLRKRYPYLAKALTSRYAPAVGASLAGFSLGIYPKGQLRISMAIYVGARALEFLYNAFEAEGYLNNKPNWLGIVSRRYFSPYRIKSSTYSQAEQEYGDFILKHSSHYIPKRPPTASTTLPWPGTYEIVDALAEMAKLNWPSFISPIILPRHTSPLPPTIDPKTSSITSSAHPLLHSHALSCALLHPSDPSCLHAFLTHMLISTPSLLRFFTIILSALSLPRYKSFLTSPLLTLNSLSKRILKLTFIISSAIGVSWSSVCLFQQILPRKMIPQWRFFLGGFLGGLFAYFDRQGGRATAIYAARTSADSLWKVGIKRRWWKGVKGGDLIVFTTSLAILGCVMERNESVVGKGWEKKMLEILRGDGELSLKVQRGDEMGEMTDLLEQHEEEIIQGQSNAHHDSTNEEGDEEGGWKKVIEKDQ